MSVKLSKSSYGKGSVRLSKVIRHEDRHELVELSVEVVCEGDFETAHTKGDNTEVLPTDTQKNTVYLIAQNHPLDTIESYALTLSDHFVKNNPHFDKVTVRVDQVLWGAIPVDGQPYPYSFQRTGTEKWTTEVQQTQDGVSISSGIKDLFIAKTTKSGFSNFRRDDFTTLKDTDDRVFGTNLSATWEFNDAKADFKATRANILQALTETFAQHDSLSVQHTLYAMGEKAIHQADAIHVIHIEMPNKHHLLFNVAPFGRTNENEIFHVIDEPFGIIRGSVARA